jgi:solute carrier family 10 (sodium/bile acid cotransporter), member 7
MPLRGWRPDPFLLALGVAVTAAALAPNLGVQGGPLHVHAATRFAVSLVFFLHGAVLPLQALGRGLQNVRLHLVTQVTTFLVFPGLGALVLLGGHGLPPAIALGFFFMSTVSSTISSSVALTAMARGDIAGALFNATLSGILGVFVTPLYASLTAPSAGVALSLPNVIESVALKIVMPLILGQLMRPLIGSFLTRHPHLVHWTDRCSIILIVYGAFCESVSAGVWTHAAIVPAIVSVAIAVVILVLASAILMGLIRICRLDRASGIAAYFCGSQKSLANGLPIAHAVFGSSASIGLIVMPLLVYHQIQLASGAIVARRLGKRGPV